MTDAEELIERVAGAVAVVQRWQRRELTSRERDRLLGRYLNRTQIYALAGVLGPRTAAADVERMVRQALSLPFSAGRAPRQKAPNREKP